MARSRTTRLSGINASRTSWYEPLRTPDFLLKLPNGRSIRPTEKLREVPAKAISKKADASMTTSSQTFAPVSNKMHLADGTPHRREDGPLAASFFDRTLDQTVGYDGDAEDGDAEHDGTAFDSRVEFNESRMPVIDADALDDDELLAGVERDSEDEGDQNPVAVSAQSGYAIIRTGPSLSHQRKTLREGTETIRPHPTDTSKMIVSYQYTDQTGTFYTQDTEIPQVVAAPANSSSEPSSIIVPEVEQSKVPRVKKGLPWTPVPGTSRYEWVRGSGDQQERWRVVVFFRRLDRDTHAYQDIYINTNLLKNVNPDDKKFRTSYNKWILQFARRRDATYTQKVARVHWNVAERRALYTAINAFCAKFGIHHFGFTEACKLSTQQLQLMADAVNAQPNLSRTTPRGVDAVRGQIVSAHNKAQPKNKAIYELRKRGDALRARVARGEVVPRAERKPEAAIALSDFPTDPPVETDLPLAIGGTKRKHATTVTRRDLQPSDSELSSVPVSDVESDGVSTYTWITTDEEILPGESDEGNWTDTEEEIMPGDDDRAGVEVEDVAFSPPAKRARIE